MEDMLLINKPKGITSFDVIRKLRRKLGVRKMGHAGTLDPLASGLLIVGVGSGTKKLKDFIKLPKEYKATVLLGVSTDTGDLEGNVTDQQSVLCDTKEISSAVEGMVGTLQLPVPQYSAVKVDGRPLYSYARAGEEVSVPVKEMVVSGAVLESVTPAGDGCLATVTFSVSSGTYIRSLAEELGRRMGIPATLSDLVRTKIGTHSLADAADIDTI